MNGSADFVVQPSYERSPCEYLGVEIMERISPIRISRGRKTFCTCSQSRYFDILGERIGENEACQDGILGGVRRPHVTRVKAIEHGFRDRFRIEAFMMCFGAGDG